MKYVNYSELERMMIAQLEYKEMKNKIGNKNVRTVSKINNKLTGEQPYVMTNTGYVPEDTSKHARAQVTQVTVIYRESSFGLTGDALLDWGLNDIPTGVQVINQGGAVAMPQLQSSSSI